MVGRNPSSSNQLLTASVVIPAFTLDRWKLIERAIDSARHQHVKPEAVILCVDNNTELLLRATRRWRTESNPVVRVIPNQSSDHLAGRALHERAHGTSRRFGAGSARNTGGFSVTSDVIAFLDDDAWAEPNWLEELLLLYADPRVVAVGGASLPYYETSRPRWFPENFDWVFGCSYSGLPNTPGPLRHLVGSNMSVRRSAFATVGGFIGSDFDDLNLCMRLIDAYGTQGVIYTPTAVAHHFVSRDRVSWRYFYRRCYFVNRQKVSVLERIGGAANLKAEREFVFRALRYDALGCLRRVARGDLSAVGQLAAMITGIVLAALGYSQGRVWRRSDDPFHSPPMRLARGVTQLTRGRLTRK